MAGRTRIKVCCISGRDEAQQAVEAGADALGLVAEMPCGPGPISDVAIRDIAGSVPPPVATFLLTSRTRPEPVVEHVRRCRTNVVQLVDEVSVDTYAALRAEFPFLKVVQVIHVQGDQSVDAASTAAEHADALLLDSGKPDGAVKTLGGTGEVHDWSLSAMIVKRVDVPVFLAGGLNSRNVAEAIRRVSPYGVDLCSGVRTQGRLDRRKLAEFVLAVRSVCD